MVVRTVSGTIIHKILTAVNEKGRTPDPGLEWSPTFLGERLLEEARDELLPELYDLTTKNFSELTDEDFNKVIEEIADVRLFSEWLEEAVMIYYRQVREDQLFHTWNTTFYSRPETGGDRRRLRG